MKKTTWILLPGIAVVAVLLMRRDHSNRESVVSHANDVATEVVVHSYTACITEPQPCSKDIIVCAPMPDRKVPEYLLPAGQH